ncbi:hypothetical protein CAEBREN_24863 [Caenorhabditis brenneri]|uniref:Uncharacterized protein n=1 Tax=Caenorhabditis brenneri TaxID=135651 RepID=G0N9D6_CAEBE|nr:hypothetical protein CAEBREN_24863 [Caenorhabditis brenneri]
MHFKNGKCRLFGSNPYWIIGIPTFLYIQFFGSLPLLVQYYSENLEIFISKLCDTLEVLAFSHEMNE